MRIVDLLSKESIALYSNPQNKQEALEQLIGLMANSGKLADMEAYRSLVLAREQESTTGIGGGIGIPHGKGGCVLKPGLAAMVVRNGVEFEALDGEPVTLLFLIAAPDTADNTHLEVLSRLSRLIMDEGLANALRQAASVQEFLDALDAADSGAERAVKSTAGNVQERLTGKEVAEVPVAKLLAVTACPTGIAHTYMAAEGLEQAAKEKHCAIKVETRGSTGAKNVLTAEEIKEADCIIVAADAKVPMERFDGKRVIVCQVSDGISKAEELVELALSDRVAVFHGERSGQEPAAEVREGILHKFYTQLMNGVSHMLPFVVGGGILIAFAYLIDGLNVDINSLSPDQRGDFGTITPIAAIFKNIGDIAFGLMLPALAGFIAMAIGDRPALAIGFVGGMMAANGKSGFLGALVAGFLAGLIALGLKKLGDKLPEALEKLAPVLIYPVFGILAMGLTMLYVIEPVMGGLNLGLNQFLNTMGGSSKIVLGLILGGMMAIDMGGPFNKAAYVFGTAAIAAGNYDIMAAVMLGGMTPPCGIMLATLLFKNKFTKEEREAGPTGFIMGLAFITEGAIPYVAADPIHVSPSCIIGAGVSGALSMAFGCTLMAPHGGIFVFPTVGNGWMYLVALLAGTAVTALLLGVLKKKL